MIRDELRGPGRRVARRRLLQAGLALVAGGPLLARGQARVPVADMHSHFGMISRNMAIAGLADDMRKEGIALVAWKLVADGRWIRSTPSGIEQRAVPIPGELAQFFHGNLDRMRAYVAEHKLRTVLARADVDACVAGEPGIVLASEGADFLEGKLDGLDAVYAKGLRHLQLVHYIRTPVGDRQTSKPENDGLSAMGKELVEACNARGILVDLAHSSGESVDQALEIATAPLIWSHGWVAPEQGRWQDAYGFLQRRLSLAHAKKIADRGGVIGLWALGLTRAAAGWSVSAGNQAAYARELADLVDKIGADHVAIGTDMEGVGPNAAVNNYRELRKVIDILQEMKLADHVVERVAYANYARVLKAALKA